MRLRQLLKRQDGITLIMAVGILGMLSLTGVTLIYYSSTNARSAEYSMHNASAYDLAEAGIDEMMAVLWKPTNNALMPDLLPETTHDYEGGTVTWSGTLDQLTQTWSLTSTGRIDNPTGQGASDVSRTLTAKVPVTPTLTQPLNNPAWNYIYATGTGQPCDMTVSNNVTGSSRLYVEGNLCLQNNVAVMQTSLLVRGNLDLMNNAQVGSSTSMSTRVEAYVGGNCRYGVGSWATPCTGNQDARRIYSKMNPPSYVVGVNTAVPVIAAPTADVSAWYDNAIPGPSLDCSTANGARSGTPPTWDNDGVRNNSVPVFNLTSWASYTCRVGPETSPTGELSWNATTRVLTVHGTMFIDGSLKLTNGLLNSYNGQGTLYLSGTVYMNNNTKLCAGIYGSECDFSSWNPNTEMLTFVAGGSGGLAGSGVGILMDNGAQFQGGLFSSYAVRFANNSRSDGPIVGSTMIFDNNVSNDQFDTITTVPVGMPGNPAVYAQPNPPQLYSG
ncbi:MAG TPA: pilus assembly PilX N-terminal domain-containing protein [Gaiellaceae bacterium]|nr:pilus assembly PilX N-terminal domain-containing protein [Gaiellaceae bacterium]